MTTETKQTQDSDIGPGLRDGAAAVVTVVVAAWLLAAVEGAIPPSAWQDPLLWSASGAGAAAVQFVLWTRRPRALAPVGLLLVVGAVYGTNNYGESNWEVLAETPLAWVTAVGCLVAGLVWYWHRST